MNNFDFNQSQNSFSKDFNSSIMNYFYYRYENIKYFIN